MLKISTGQKAVPPPVEDAPEVPLAPEVPEEEPQVPEPIEQSATPLPKTTVLYMDGHFGPFECGNCCYFVQPGSCRVVAGSIDPIGCCNLFCPPNHDDVNDPEPEERPIEEAEMTPDSEMMTEEDEDGIDSGAGDEFVG